MLRNIKNIEVDIEQIVIYLLTEMKWRNEKEAVTIVSDIFVNVI